MRIRDESKNKKRETTVEQNLQYLHTQSGLQPAFFQDVSVVSRRLLFYVKLHTVYRHCH